MLILEKVRWKNFLSFGNIFTEYDFNHPLTVIKGTNFSGKSTLLDIITFALYSKSYRQIPKPLLINCINKRDLLVEMEFTSYNHKFLVRRGLKPNIFEYYKDGILIEQDAKAKDYQKQFEEEALKINYEIFTQLVIVGKSNYTQFMKLPLGSRRLLIEQLLDLNIFSTMKTILGDKQTVVQKELKELQNEKSVLDKNKSILQNLLQEEQSSKIESIDHFDIDIDKNQKRISELESINKTLSEENQNLLSKVKDNTKLKQDREKHNTLSTQLKVKSSSVLKEINFFKNNDSCPSCSQTITHLRDSKLPELEEKNSKLESAIKEVLNRYETTVKVIEENTSLIEKIQKNETVIRTNTSIINEIKSNSKSLEIKKNSIQKFNEDKIISLQYQISKIDEDLEANRNLNKNFLQKKDHYDKIEPLLKDSGLKAIIVKKYIPIFNKLINHYLGKLGLYVRFELDEEFNEKILNRNLDNFVYNSFSEGQRQRIDLAMLLTWREITKLKNSIDCNLLIFDETLDSSLDQSGVDAFMDIMNNMKNVNIAIITHTPEKLKNSGRTLQYKLVGSFSQIKENVND